MDVLLVADGSHLLSGLSAALRVELCEVIEVNLGSRALDLFGQRVFPVVLVALHPVDMSGFDLLKRFRQAGGSPCLIACAKKPTIADVVEAMRSGATDVVDASSSGDALVGAVLAAFGKRSTWRPSTSNIAGRWASAVLRVMNAATDIKTVTSWALHVGTAPATLRGWCEVARLSPKPSLDLARLIRAVHLGHTREWHPEKLLDVAHSRTLSRLLAAGGLQDSSRISIAELLERQTLVRDAAALQELREQLNVRGLVAERRGDECVQTPDVA